MTTIYKIIRALIVTALIVAIGVPLVLYVVLSMDSVQNKIRDIGEKELSSLLGADVKIGSINIQPFNKLSMRDVNVIVQPGDTALHVDRLGAGVLMYRLVANRRLIFSHAEIIGLDGKLHRDSVGAPLNIQPIIDKLSPKDKTKPPTLYDLRINNIVIRRGSVSYDILDKKSCDDGRFDKNHIKVYDLKADILLPKIKNDDYRVDLKRLSLKEKSGLNLESFSGKFNVSDKHLSLNSLEALLPKSRLSVENFELDYNGWNDLKERMKNIPFHLIIGQGNYVTPSDISAFVPVLSSITTPVYFDADVKGTLENIDIASLDINNGDKGLDFSVSGSVEGLSDVSNAKVRISDLYLDCNISDIFKYYDALIPLKPHEKESLARLGYVNVSGNVNGQLNDLSSRLDLMTGIGSVYIDAQLERSTENQSILIDGTFKSDSIGLATVLPDTHLGAVAFDVQGNVMLTGNTVNKADVGIYVPKFEYKGRNINNLNAHVTKKRDMYGGWLLIDDDVLSVMAEADVNKDASGYGVDGKVDIYKFIPSKLGMMSKYEGYNLMSNIVVDLHGPHFENLDGRLDMKNFRFSDVDGQGVHLDRFSLLSSGSTNPQYLTVSSDIFDGQLIGSYKFKNLVAQIKNTFSQVLPALIKNPNDKLLTTSPSEVLFTFDIKENETTAEWMKFLNTPMRILKNITFNGSFNSDEQYLSANLDIPYLLNKDKFIDNTSLQLTVEGNDKNAQLYFTTMVPSKKGTMNLVASVEAEDNKVDARFNWDVDNPHSYKGKIDMTSYLSSSSNSGLEALININKSEAIVNDTIWTIHPATIIAQPKLKFYSVDNFDVSRDQQFIKINGVASSNPEDELCLQLRNIDLDYVFETLAIEAAMFGGVATGDFYASNLFSDEPRISTPGLTVENLSYNQALMGNAKIVSTWDNENKGITIVADILQPNGYHSYVNGAIFPLAESLDFNFKAEKLNVKFMKPYMSAFTSDVDGFATGEARLFGTFKLIDMTGEVWAEDLSIKLDFTNTYYTTSDSIHLTPGRIDFSDVVLKDKYGNSAKLTGWVTHKCFKEPEFEFNIFDADNFLCYDVTEKINPIWYGHVFCKGGAVVKGVPGYIDMNVNISTAPLSTFTFVLSDAEAAEEYTFLTFHDRDEIKGNLLLSVEDPQTANIRRLKEYYARLNRQEESASVYRMNLLVDVTPQAEMILVMDPVGGDRIKARGNGNLRMEYNSADEDLKMFGTYTLAQGNYNFTLQDIIIKDFTIKPGSSIAFHGNPYAAQLDIDAVYQVNANLSDLDESFLQDRDLNRTNVPVHALLKVDGEMQQPDISFDLEFPTLTQDTYRKVKSIVSTEDMMNRQIIYLLALNRFYTPDYMASTTKGNELFSVASSTISSQLSSMLGHLSDNWSIAPSIRSDRGDFSDTEVDLALSSYLLNNRLLFNGNFGYRDKALNNNSFIGDFDIEYLLNRSGNIRLKAYNRYNDQNYYVKSALTTQGVGVVFKRDFDSFLSFLRRLKKKKDNPPSEEKREPVAVPEDEDWLKIGPKDNDGASIPK